MTVAGEDLRGERIGNETHMLAHVGLYERIDARVGAHGARDGAGRGDFTRLRMSFSKISWITAAT